MVSVLGEGGRNLLNAKILYLDLCIFWCGLKNLFILVIVSDGETVA
jgi:hypothetical protein